MWLDKNPVSKTDDNFLTEISQVGQVNGLKENARIE